MADRNRNINIKKQHNIHCATKTTITLAMLCAHSFIIKPYNTTLSLSLSISLTPNEVIEIMKPLET